MLAYASGMATFSAHNPNNVWDMVPCDTVCALIAASCTTLAAAAGVTAGAAPRVRAALALAGLDGDGDGDGALAAAARAARGGGGGPQAAAAAAAAPVPLVRKLSAALSRAASPSKAALNSTGTGTGAGTDPASPRPLDSRGGGGGSFGRAVSGGGVAALSSRLLLSTPATFVNTSTVRDEPLVFHAATSVANPIRYGWLLLNSIVPYFFDNPPRHRFYQGEYLSIHRWSSFMPDNTLVFRLFVLFYTLKFFLISCLMKLKGLPKLATTVWQGWQAYSLYNSSRLDFQLFFCVRNAAKLQRLLDASEGSSSKSSGGSSDVQQLGSGACAATTDAAATPVVWRGSWFKYVNRHCEVVNARYFSEAAVAAATAGGSRPKAGAASAKKADDRIAAAALPEGEASASATGAQLLSSSTAAKLVSSSNTSKPTAASVPLSLIPKPRGPPSAASIAKAVAYLRERVGDDAFDDTTMGSADAGPRRRRGGGLSGGGGSPLPSASPSPPATPNGKVGGFEGGERAPLLGARSR